MSTHIIVSGNPVDGFNFYGPFGDKDEAFEWGDHECEDSWWPAELQPVEDLPIVEEEPKPIPNEVKAFANELLALIFVNSKVRTVEVKPVYDHKIVDGGFPGTWWWSVLQYKDGTLLGGDAHWLSSVYAERAKAIYDIDPSMHGKTEWELDEWRKVHHDD